jgi:hypothetical protein
MSYRIKGVILIMFLALLPLTCASTYIVGSHQVSFNVSEPYNSSAKIDPPIHVPEGGDCWMYNLNMTPDQQHDIIITVIELPSDSSGRWLSLEEDSRQKEIQEDGIGGYKSSTMDFEGYRAFQESFPAQTVSKIAGNKQFFETHTLMFQFDERTIVTVVTMGDKINVPYQEILDTIKVTEAPTKPTKYAPYISQ